MNTAIIYGIPNCDTVRKARKWLEDHHVAYDFVDLREQTPSRARISTWLKTLGADTLINRRSTTFKQLSSDAKALLEGDDPVAVLLEHPTLIKRPVLEYDGGLVVGFTADDYITRWPG